MSDLLDYKPWGVTKYVEARTPTASEPNAQVDDTFVDSTTGLRFSCIVATQGSQEWLGSDGLVYPITDITSPNHPDLLVLYTMDNISGSTLVDESGNAYNGTIIQASSVAGKIDNAMTFGQPAGRVESTFSLNTSGSFSFTGWMYKRTGAGSGRIGFSVGADERAAIKVSSNEQTNADLKDDSLNTATINKGAISTLQYYFVAVIVDKDTDTFTFYLDTSPSSTPIANIGNLSGNLTIASKSAVAEEIALDWDQVRVFSKALDSSEVTALFAEGTP